MKTRFAALALAIGGAWSGRLRGPFPTHRACAIVVLTGASGSGGGSSVRLGRRAKWSQLAELIALASQGLRELGFAESIARRAVSSAAADLDARASLEALVRASLRHTRPPCR